MSNTPLPISNLTAISGGIGSGKSVVARIVAAMGYEVYDCDLRARAIMESAEIMSALLDEFGESIFDSDGRLLRPALAAIVFADSQRLSTLNAITHRAVRDDLAAWASGLCDRSRIFVETAILYQSGIDSMVSQVWEVEAPRETRIGRVAARNGMARADIEARICSQDSFIPSTLHPHTVIIINDGLMPLLPQVEKAFLPN